MEDILECLIAFLSNFPKDTSDEIKLYLERPKLITFIVKTENQIEERIKFNDPLYSLNTIRNKNDDKAVDVIFTMEGIMDVSLVQKEIVLKKKGFAKMVNYDNLCYEWRDCRVKNSKLSNRKMITFTCFEKRSNIIW